MAHVIIGEPSLTAKLHRIPSVGERIQVRSPSHLAQGSSVGGEHLVLEVISVELVDAELSHLKQHADAIVEVRELRREGEN
jgi:hypothetical protein